MKRHVETISDSFVDYAGKTHHFVIAAVSKMLPKDTNQLDQLVDEDPQAVFYDVDVIIDEEGTVDTLCSVTKALYMGISICNPEDTFDEEIGKRKAISRATKVVLLTPDPGIINTRMVNALLEQEAMYLKNNPDKFIKGYNEMKARYEKNHEMQKLANDFSDTEKAVVTEIDKNPKFLDKIFKYLKWHNDQKRGRNVKGN